MQRQTAYVAFHSASLCLIWKAFGGSHGKRAWSVFTAEPELRLYPQLVEKP